MKYVSINDAWKQPESLRNMKHPAHARQKKQLEERKQFDEYKKSLSYMAPSYPWTDKSRDRYLNGYYPPPPAKYQEQLNPGIPWGSPFRFWQPQNQASGGKWSNGFDGPNPGRSYSMPSMGFPIEGFNNTYNCGKCDTLVLVIYGLIFLVIALLCIISIQASTIKRLS